MSPVTIKFLTRIRYGIDISNPEFGMDLITTVEFMDILRQVWIFDKLHCSELANILQCHFGSLPIRNFTKDCTVSTFLCQHVFLSLNYYDIGLLFNDC